MIVGNGISLYNEHGNRAAGFAIVSTDYRDEKRMLRLWGE